MLKDLNSVYYMELNTSTDFYVKLLNIITAHFEFIVLSKNSKLNKQYGNDRKSNVLHELFHTLCQKNICSPASEQSSHILEEGNGLL